MKYVTLKNLNLLDFGNSIVLRGCIYHGGTELYLVPFPGEEIYDNDLFNILNLSAEEMEEVIRQTDMLNVEVGPNKIILRKSQRIIDNEIAWNVFERDGYKCRYCGQRKPLTVDHIDLWEEGGITVSENLVASCRDCNRTRGRMPYEEWLDSREYKKRSAGLDSTAKMTNKWAADSLPGLRARRIPLDKIRSR